MSFYNNMDLFREAKEQQSGDKEAYEKFFQATLKKFGADSPQDLEKEKRKEFFDYVNKNWKAQDESVVTEETVYIEYLNKDKGFRPDRKTFKGKNAYEDAVKWAEKNLGKFNPDMIKFESTMKEDVDFDDDEVNHRNPMTGKMPDADAQNKDGQREKDKVFKRWHDAATEVHDHPYHENQDGSAIVDPAPELQTFTIEQLVAKYSKDQTK